MLMDVETLKEYSRFAIQIDCNYRNRLKRMLEDPGYSVFAETIKYMVENGIKLEQECIDIARVQLIAQGDTI